MVLPLFSSPFRRRLLASGRVSPSPIGAAASFLRPLPCCGGGDAGRAAGQNFNLAERKNPPPTSRPSPPPPPILVKE